MVQVITHGSVLQLQRKKIIILVLCICTCWVAVVTSSSCIVPATSAIAPQSPCPGITLSSSPIDKDAGEHDNKASYEISTYLDPEVGTPEHVKLSINSSSADNYILKDYSFSESEFNLNPGNTKTVTLSMTINYGTTPGNYTVKVDGNATVPEMEWLPPETASTACYVDVYETVVPLPPPVAVPEYNVIGLLALIGILSVVLAAVMRRR